MHPPSCEPAYRPSAGRLGRSLGAMDMLSRFTEFAAQRRGSSTNPSAPAPAETGGRSTPPGRRKSASSGGSLSRLLRRGPQTRQGPVLNRSPHLPPRILRGRRGAGGPARSTKARPGRECTWVEGQVEGCRWLLERARCDLCRSRCFLPLTRRPDPPARGTWVCACQPACAQLMGRPARPCGSRLHLHSGARHEVPPG